MATSKRHAEISLEGTSKKFKGDPPLFHTRFRRSALDVLGSQWETSNIFLSVKVVMIWRPDPQSKEFRYKVCFRDMMVDQQPNWFEVVFTGRCMLLWHYLDMAIDDELEISTRGASFIHVSLEPHDRIKLPLRLVYEDGCIIKFIRRRGKEDNVVVNLWSSMFP
jgi:hypothetical protein